MKYYVLTAVLGFAIGFHQVAVAGMLSPENANNQGSAAVQAQIETDVVSQEHTDWENVVKETEKAEAEKATEKAAKEREDACKTAGDSSKPDGVRAAAQRKCNEVTVDTPAPQSSVATDYKAMGEAHANMMNNQLTKATENLGGFKTIDVKQGGIVDTSKLMSTESLLTKEAQLDNTTGAAGGIKTVKVATYDAADIRELQGKATVVIGGDGSLGFNPNANKYESMRGGSVIWDDSLLKTDVETARAVRFGQSELSPKGTNYNGFNQSVGIEPGMEKRLGGLTSNQLEMAAYIDARGRDLGASEAERMVAISTAMRESKFDSMVSANPNGQGPYKLYVDSSAYGLGQYINGTWVNQFDPKKMGDYVMNGGEVLNRNNTTNQIDVLYNNISQRYDSYNNSANAQSKYTFAEYDYIHHYAGSMSASQDRIQFAVDYTRKNRNINETVAKYAMFSDGSGNIVAGHQKNYPWAGPASSGNAYTGVAVGTASTGNNGLGTTIQNILGGGGGNVVSNAVNTLFGNSGVNTNGTLNIGNILGDGTSGATSGQGLASALIAKLFGGGSSGSSSSGGSSGSATASNGATTTTTTTTTTYSYDALKKLQSVCGGDLPASKDSVMLMIKTCQGA